MFFSMLSTVYINFMMQECVFIATDIFRSVVDAMLVEFFEKQTLFQPYTRIFLCSYLHRIICFSVFVTQKLEIPCKEGHLRCFEIKYSTYKLNAALKLQSMWNRGLGECKDIECRIMYKYNVHWT